MTTNQPLSDVDLAMQLHISTGSRIAWEDLDPEVRRDFLIQACRVNNQRVREDREEAAARAKLAAVDAYRVSIVGTIPAHRLDTRLSGFLDGWDAALAQQAS